MNNRLIVPVMLITFLFSVQSAVAIQSTKKEYYPTGELKAEWRYDNGLLNGTSREYYNIDWYSG